MASDQAGVDAIHTAKIGLGLRLEHPELRRAPPPAQVDSQTPVLGEGVLNPVGTRPVFYDDNDPAVVVEVPDGDATALSRTPAERLDDERIPPRVGRSRYTGDDRRVRDGVRYSHYGSRKSHESSPRRPTEWRFSRGPVAALRRLGCAPEPTTA